jgi:hypothetical protein
MGPVKPPRLDERGQRLTVASASGSARSLTVTRCQNGIVTSRFPEQKRLALGPLSRLILQAPRAET